MQSTNVTFTSSTVLIGGSLFIKSGKVYIKGNTTIRAEGCMTVDPSATIYIDISTFSEGEAYEVATYNCALPPSVHVETINGNNECQEASVDVSSNALTVLLAKRDCAKEEIGKEDNFLPIVIISLTIAAVIVLALVVGMLVLIPKFNNPVRENPQSLIEKKQKLVDDQIAQTEQSINRIETMLEE